jgi:hypothetical protein
MLDHNLPKEPSGLIVTKSVHGFRKREHPVDNGFEQVYLDCSVHGYKLGSAPDRYESESGKRTSQAARLIAGSPCDNTPTQLI